MAHKWDPDAMRWIPYEQPFSRPRPRQVNRHMLLRGLAEEVVYEDSVAQRYAGLLAAVICDGNSTAKREYEQRQPQREGDQRLRRVELEVARELAHDLDRDRRHRLQRIERQVGGDAGR